MQYVRVMVAVALAACATSPPRRGVHVPIKREPLTGNKHFGPPGPTSEARPWKVGQWVRYERRHAGGIAHEQLSVVAQDTCGFWIERWIHEDARRTTWLFCVRTAPSRDDPHVESPSIVIARRNREVLYVADGLPGAPAPSSFGWLVSLVDAPWPGRTDLPREDIATPVGQFEQAAKVTTTEGAVETTRWSHPAVPLGGIVKEVTADHERVLVDFGMSSRARPIADLVYDLELAQRSFREVGASGPWVDIQVGLDSLGTPNDSNSSYRFGSFLGFPVGASLDTVGRGVALGARIGLVTTQGRDWSLGLELHDHVALLNGDEGLRHLLGVSVFLQLFTRPMRYTLPW